MIDPGRASGALAPAVGLLVLALCGAPALAGPPVNKLCPVMTAEEIDPEITIENQGRTIGFCCQRCVEKFRADPQRYLAALPAPAGPQTAQPAAEALLPASPPADPGAPPPWPARIHPAVVHLPIASIPIALLAVLVWKLSGRSDFARADVVPLLVAGLSSLLALYTGNVAEESLRFGAQQLELVERHERAATIVLYLTLALCVLRLFLWKRCRGGWLGVYVLGLLVAAGLVGLTGFLGGSLVFGPDHFSW